MGAVFSPPKERDCAVRSADEARAAAEIARRSIVPGVHPAPTPTAVSHASDCAIHNAPALPVGPCDCGTDQQEKSENG